MELNPVSKRLLWIAQHNWIAQHHVAFFMWKIMTTPVL
jgi:hypothetical protein